MFNDLDDTLRALLTSIAPSAPVELRNADISFSTPDQTFTPARDTLNVFLYGVSENRQMRDPAPIIERSNGQYERRRPPIRVDCAYLVTAWSTATGDVKIAREHRLLGLALAWLNRFPLIPPAFLQGSLTNQPFDPPTVVAQMDHQEHVGEFWSALGVSPRPAFTLIATIALELDAQIEGPPVVTSELRFEQMDIVGSVAGHHLPDRRHHPRRRHPRSGSQRPGHPGRAGLDRHHRRRRAFPLLQCRSRRVHPRGDRRRIPSRAAPADHRAGGGSQRLRCRSHTITA